MSLFDIFKKRKIELTKEELIPPVQPLNCQSETDDGEHAVSAELCKSDSHDFVWKTKGNLGAYQCKNCSLSATAFPRERLNMTYLGSYIDGCSWVWKNEDMTWKHIKELFVSISTWADSYDVSVEGAHLVWKRSACWRPDLPKDFFAEHKIKLTYAQQKTLHAALAELDCSKWFAKPDDFDAQIVPAMPASTYSPVFRCTFQNGRSFECGKRPEELRNIECLLLKFMGVTIPNRPILQMHWTLDE